MNQQPLLSVSEQVARAVRRFLEHFDRPPTVAVAAPGRVNLIGEHVDYNDGFVLPMALDRQTVIVAAPAAVGDPHAHAVSVQMDEPAAFTVGPGLEPGEPAWANYVRGVAAGFVAGGHRIGGFDAVIDSQVPVGSGLSSSAALEVAAATMLEQLFDHRLDPRAKALLCQEAEHRFAGVPCGIMDQFISVMGQAGHALLLDCRSRETRLVPLADPSVAVLIVDTRVEHALTGGEYAQRRAQCEQAAAALGIASLRDTDMTRLIKAKPTLDPIVFRRAYHVISEIDRTQRAAELLEAGDFEGFGRLMYDSHVTLRDAFEVSCDELDLLVDIAADIGPRGGVYGSRMTGGGFGGCTVSLVRADKIDAVTRRLYTVYLEKTGIEPAVFVTRPADGARPVGM